MNIQTNHDGNKMRKMPSNSAISNISNSKSRSIKLDFEKDLSDNSKKQEKPPTPSYSIHQQSINDAITSINDKDNLQSKGVD